jgi:hypothetical protein
MINNSTNAEHKMTVSDETKKEIIKKIEKNYMDDVNAMICGKKCWHQTGISFETMSKMTVAIGGVLSFSSGYFNSTILSFVSGSVSIISLALLQFGSFGFKQSKKRENDLNILLKKLDLETIPVTEYDPEALASEDNKTILFKGIKQYNKDYTGNNTSNTQSNEKSNICNNIKTENILLDIVEFSSPINSNKINIIEDIKIKDALNSKDINDFNTT